MKRDNSVGPSTIFFSWFKKEKRRKISGYLTHLIRFTHPKCDFFAWSSGKEKVEKYLQQKLVSFFSMNEFVEIKADTLPFDMEKML